MRTRIRSLAMIALLVLAVPAATGAKEEKRYCLGGVCRSSCILDTCLWVSTNSQYGIIEVENGFDVPIGVRIRWQVRARTDAGTEW